MSGDTTGRKSTTGARSRVLSVDGVPFTWWVVGERPAVVTVRMPMLGSLTESTDGDPAELALALAKQLLAQHESRAVDPKRPPDASATVPALKKPGWFEPGDSDFTSTVF